MKKLKTICISVFIVLYICKHIEAEVPEPYVRNVEPNRGSLHGETRITLSGTNFAKSQFNFGQGNENLGSKVDLISEVTGIPHECIIHKDGCHDKQITCYTPKLQEGDYFVRASVDGVKVPLENHCPGQEAKCKFTASEDNTPTITNVSPATGVKGTKIRLSGKIVTTRFGSNLALSTNDVVEKLLRVYLGSRNCELKDLSADTLYSLKLDDDGRSYYGHMDCIGSSTYIGNVNASFIIEGKYGRSRPDMSVLKVSSDNTIYMYQQYTTIDSVTPAEGSTSGGTKVRLTGNYFDKTDADPAVYIDDTVCAVQGDITDTEILCVTQADPATVKPFYKGNRGLTCDVWTGTSLSGTSRAEFDTLPAPSFSKTIDEAFMDSTDFDSVSRMSGFFVAPFDSQYRFYVKGDKKVALYLSTDEDPANLEKLAESRSATTHWRNAFQESKIVSLNKGKSYYMEVLHLAGTSASTLQVAARAYQTRFTSSMTGAAVQEKQKISVTSTVRKETQVIKVTSAGTGSAKATVQTVTVSGESGDTYRLGLHGVYTEPLTIESTGEGMKAVLDKLPSIAPSTVSVTMTELTENLVYTITFNMERGDIPLLSVKTDGSSISVDVAKPVNGEPSLTVFNIGFDGIPSPDISIGASAEEVEAALTTLFSVRCPQQLGAKGSSKYFQDFERPVTSTFGTRVSDEEPFCGMYSTKNPNYIFKKPNPNKLGISLSQHRYLCFAYRGEVVNVKFWFSYEKNDQTRGTNSGSFTVPQSNTASSSWLYHCEDIAAIAKTRNSDPDHRIDSAKIFRKETDLFIDSVRLTRDGEKDAEGVLTRRMAPAKPNGFRIKTVEVTSPEAGVYTIVMTPYNCGHDLPLLSLAYGKTSDSTSSTSARAVFSLNNGGASLTVEVTRDLTTGTATPPVSRRFRITYEGKTTEAITAYAEAEVVAEELMALSTVDHMTVEREGDCANFDYILTWLSQPGDLNPVTVDSSLAGNNVNVEVSTVVDGSLWFDPIMGDMLQTAHTKPQIRAYINKIPTACSSDCSFEWSSSVLPTVTGVNPTSGSLNDGTTIRITGTGFNADTSNTVTVGEVACTYTAPATATDIVCDVGNGPFGARAVVVDVAGKGLASGSVQFSYTSGVTGISPTAGSIGGGTMLTVNGYGFTKSAAVNVDGVLCQPSTTPTTTSQITCYTPQSVSTTASAVSVTVTQLGSELTSPVQFQYNNVAVITSLSTHTSSVGGGGILTITGTGFGSTANPSEPVTIGGKVATVTSYTDTVVMVTLPSNPPDSYPVLLQIGGVGYADRQINSIADIVYELKVTNMFPDAGSLYGGTKVTLTGVGFSGDAAQNSVTIGNHVCDVESAIATEIKCTIRDTGKVHTVTNEGFHKDFGYLYGWKPSAVDVEVGDYVLFSWSLPSWVRDRGYGIHETQIASTIKLMRNGFTSGPQKTANGHYKYRFSVPGTYYYWSGWVDEYEIISLKGSVTVVDKTSHTQVLRLTVSGQEAIYQPGGADPSPTAVCPGTLDDISQCTDTKPADLDVAKFNFKFWSCRSPVVTDVSRNSGSTIDDVILTGTGFSSTECHNEVTVGDGKGLLQSVAPTSLTFRIDPSTSPSVGISNDVILRVGNLGYALVQMKGDAVRRFALTPAVEAISPLSGSTAGGTKLTITGTGFVNVMDDIQFDIGGDFCTVKEMTYTQIICMTPPAPRPMKAAMKFVVNSIPAECKAENCKFTYALSKSPSVTAVTPSTVSSSPTTLTITGKLFGTVTADVTVEIGGQTCSVTASDDTTITCDVSDVPVGTHSVKVFIAAMGMAVTTATVQSTATVSDLSPLTGSINGGLELSVNGNGFVADQTTVDVDGSPCEVSSVEPSVIKCVTPPHAAGAVSVIVTSNGVVYPADDSFSYASVATPTVTSINPTEGVSGDTVTIVGTDFGVANSVTIGGATCTVATETATQIVCAVGPKPTGVYKVKVTVPGKGSTADGTTFEYSMTASSYSPVTGSTAGGQAITIVGSGFVDGEVLVTVCGNTCTTKTDATQTSSQYICLAPPGAADASCDVVVTVNGISKTVTPQYTYDAALTPEITGVDPSRGGTGGGTTVTITGTGFGTTDSDVQVTIGGAPCVVTPSVTDTQITCVTGSSKSQMTSVRVEIASNGIATQTSAVFEYVDVWSSRYTWGNQDPPAAGDFVVIPKDMRLVLDVDTTVLKMLLIQGGELIFDEKDVELKAENILIVDGGKLQVGTREKPFEHKGIITMYGHLRSPELPLFGAKTLAVREGSLDLHGRVTPITWTRLAATANVGDSSITLEKSVNWLVGDKIVIATTGHRHSQIESEIRSVQSVSGDGLTLELDQPLTYMHLGISETFNGVSVDFRAEVGLLTHNVLVRGNIDLTWAVDIPKCPAGFDTGEFTTQTCFQGRFGEELGSDEFGAQIMIHGPRQNEHMATARITYTEIYYAGQAFRLGRYPVHFHRNGDMSDSYVIGCGIHRTFNRAVNVHDTTNTLVAHNVIYDIRGGAFFLEDGIETGNTFEYNLGVYVHASTSLLTDDVTPATFWVTNPNNTIRHNTGTGGSHFAFWYRMEKHPTGPSYTPYICPQRVPLGIFENNTAHSLGWYGLWIFEYYFPAAGDDPCTGDSPTPAVFRSLTAWNCDKGVEAVNVGALQFHDFVLVNNEKAGYEGKLISGVVQYDEANSPMVKGGLVIGHRSIDPSSCTVGGIVFPYGNGMLVKDVHFENFDRDTCNVFTWTRIIGTCSHECGGFLYKVSGLTFVNSNNKGKFEWLAEGMVEDLDGCLTNAGDLILPTMNTLPPTKCANIPEFSKGVPASVCDASVRLHRFAFTNIEPASMEGKSLILRNEFGESQFNFQLKRITHKPGWMSLVVDGQDYSMSFQNGQQIQNISYSGAFYQFSGTDYIMMSVQADQPDRVEIGGVHIDETTGVIDPATAPTGSWKYNGDDGTVKFLVSARKREKRAALYESDRAMDMSVYRCYYRGCVKPPHPSGLLSTPEFTHKWSEDSTWSFRPEGKPVAGSSVTIPVDYWIIVDTELPVLDRLVIEGGLEIQDGDYHLIANYIYITGRLVIGWNDKPFTGKAKITLQGSHSSPYYVVDDGPVLGSKFIAVFGGLDLHGKDVGIVWTRLATTAVPGSNQITLVDAVNWEQGDEIVITTTSYNAWHTETFTISGISGNTLTLNSSLAYRHIAYSETLASGVSYTMAAEVGLLSRNIKIIGGNYDRLFDESFGARVIVARTSDGVNSYSGVAKIQNVEFYHTGQEGFVASYDARYSVTFSDVATGDTRRSYIKKSAFHNGFSPAIGSYSTNGLVVEGNVVHHTVGPGIVIESDSNNVTNNLVALSIWPGSYQDRLEKQNFLYEAGIEAMLATNLVLQGNVVAGSERAGIRYMGADCGTATTNIADNVVHSSLSGMAYFPVDISSSVTCIKWSKIFVWKNLDWGLYLNIGPSIELEDVISSENGVGVFTMVVGPSSTSHVAKNKHVSLSHSTFVGKTPSYDCASDVMPRHDDNIFLSSHTRSWSNGTHGKVGFSIAVFTSGSNGAPEKPFFGIMSYMALKGIMLASDITFARFDATCNDGEDYGITTNPGNDDGNHPLEMQAITFENVNDNNKLFYHIPNVNKINPSDCIDMDCDALKKTTLTDTDGSFLGSVGTVIPVSEYQWNGDPRRGLGDYRVPSVLLTAPDGTKLDVNTVAPKRGVIRNDQCQYKHFWRGYECHGLKYQTMIIESMDNDTETRRLSPVAILGDGYLDLINGPQDHGWCSGYTCRKRLSTFQALVATGKNYDIYFTSTTPQVLRLYMINADSTDAVRVSVWYARPNRLDVKVGGNIITAKNAEMKSGKYFLKVAQTPLQYMPDAATDEAGANFLDRKNRQIYVILKGNSVIDIVTNTQIIVSFTLPAMSVDDFFGENIIQNLAEFLNVDPRKVRIADVVNEQAVAGRRRRSVGTTTVVVEIGDEPGETGSASITYTELLTLQGQIVLLAQTGSYDSIVNATVLGVSMVEVVPSVGSSEWGQITVDDSPVPLTQAGQMTVYETPVPGKEGHPFSLPVRLQVYDTDGTVIKKLGTTTLPWQVTATLVIGSKGHSDATLKGNTTATFTDGWANFSDLAITHAGLEYTIHFAVTSPPEAANFTMSISNITILGRQVTTYVASPVDEAIVNSIVNISLGLMDYDTNEYITDITWRGHSWAVDVTVTDPDVVNGVISGLTSTTFDPTSGLVVMGVAFTGVGTYNLTFHVVTTPAFYDFTFTMVIPVVSLATVGMPIEQVNEVEMKVDAVYDPLTTPKDVMRLVNQLALENQDQQMKIVSITARPGSVIIILTMMGSLSGMNSTFYAFCSHMSGSSTFLFGGSYVPLSPHLVVNGTTYYGPSCGIPLLAVDGLHPGIIVAIVLVCLLFLGAIITIVVWRCYFHPKNKTYDTYTGKPQVTVEDFLFRDKTFMSIKSRAPSAARPPVDTQATKLGYSLYDNYEDRPVSSSSIHTMPVPQA